MVGMPYVMDKGSVFSVHDPWLNDGTDDEVRARRLEILRGFDAGLGPAEVGPLGSRSLNDPYNGPTQPPPFPPPADGIAPNEAARKSQLNKSWFDPATFWWQNWTGDAKGVFVEGAVRSVEVSLGLDHGAIPTDDELTTRLWPIEVIWVCGMPRFEVWITWRCFNDSDKKAGRVTATIATPSNGICLYEELAPAHVPQARINPVKSDDNYGMWVVGHEKTTTTSHLALVFSEKGRLATDVIPSYTASGPITTVAPLERDGGVLSEPRPYEP